MDYPTGISSVFASHARKVTTSFLCALDCRIGAYSLTEGEPLKVVGDGTGRFYLYVDWGDGAIARLSAHDVNRLAGYEAVEEEHWIGR